MWHVCDRQCMCPLRWPQARGMRLAATPNGATPGKLPHQWISVPSPMRAGSRHHRGTVHQETSGLLPLPPAEQPKALHGGVHNVQGVVPSPLPDNAVHHHKATRFVCSRCKYSPTPLPPSLSSPLPPPSPTYPTPPFPSIHPSFHPSLPLLSSPFPLHPPSLPSCVQPSTGSLSIQLQSYSTNSHSCVPAIHRMRLITSTLGRYTTSGHQTTVVCQPNNRMMTYY